MMTASEKAVHRLEDYLIKRCLAAGLGFRVVNNSHELGHAVLSIKLDNEHTGDEVITSHGIRIFVDPANAVLLKDCELDYLDEPTGGFCLRTGRIAAGGSQIKGCGNL